jgi:hypothetical protein
MPVLQYLPLQIFAKVGVFINFPNASFRGLCKEISRGPVFFKIFDRNADSQEIIQTLRSYRSIERS